MQFDRIPNEMRAYRQWIVWREEMRNGNPKPTKVPYSPKHVGKASVTNPNDWGSYAEALAAYVDSHGNVSSAGLHRSMAYSGLGFVLTVNDPYAFIDLDDTHGDVPALDRQRKVFSEFNSYSELSPSGAGLHIIIKGELPTGRRRSFIELYSNERFMTMTGNVYHDAPIVERQGLLRLLYDQMGGPATTYEYTGDQPETDDDVTICKRAAGAVNGERFTALYEGDWQSLYPSQSEADFALVDIVAFYTQNRGQIARIFRASQLGKRDKAQRSAYVEYMVRKSFDRLLPPVDIEGLKVQLELALAQPTPPYLPGLGELGSGAPKGDVTQSVPGPPPSAAIAPEPGKVTATDQLQTKAVLDPAPLVNAASWPPGLVGDIAAFLFAQAPRPVPEIALAGALALMSGICGRAYNVSGQGLNLYTLLLADTGTGKEAMATGIDKLMGAIKNSVPASQEFVGPAEIRSDAALIRWLSKYPCILSIVGEFGLRLRQMSDKDASPHEVGLRRVLLDLYHKSGHSSSLKPMAYSDREKNTQAIQSPSFSLLGESTPQRFYEALDEAMIYEGLLPRFTIIEYIGPRVGLVENHNLVQPPFYLVEMLAALCAHSLTIQHGQSIINVDQDQGAEYLFKQFDKQCDVRINRTDAEINKQLWNRAHIKALKLAAILAVGIYPYAPVIKATEAQWAIDRVTAEIEALIGKFERGETGTTKSEEGEQLERVTQAISQYVHSPWEAVSKYRTLEALHKDAVIPSDFIARRVTSCSVFKHDRLGMTAAIKRTIGTLLENDDIREIPKTQMQQRYGTTARAFVIKNTERFPKPLDKP